MRRTPLLLLGALTLLEACGPETATDGSSSSGSTSTFAGRTSTGTTTRGSSSGASGSGTTGSSSGSDGSSSGSTSDASGSSVGSSGGSSGTTSGGTLGSAASSGSTGTIGTNSTSASGSTGTIGTVGGSSGSSGGTSTTSCTGAEVVPVIVQTGSATVRVLRGTIVTPDTFFSGEVLVRGDSIGCVAASCSGESDYGTATIVDTGALVFPGLIDAHNHILFSIFDETDWSPSRSYNNHNQWTAEASYGRVVDAKQALNGEGSATTFDLGCEMLKHGELRSLLAGTTSVLGAANPTNKRCYGGLARTIDQSQNGLAADKIQVATLFPNRTSADGVCANFLDGDTTAYVIHVGEGVDQTSRNEFTTLQTVTTTPACLLAPQTAIVHGTAFTQTEFAAMATHRMSLVWSPRSNVFLYGAGTDLSKTTDIPLALSNGLNVALAPDWSMGGSHDLLDELAYARQLDLARWNVLTPKALVQMVTSNAAKALALDGLLGSLAAGKKADLFVVAGDPADPYSSLLAARPDDVKLVMVGGEALAGTTSLRTLGSSTQPCDTVDLCCRQRFVCAARASTATGDKATQTVADFEGALVAGMAAYDTQANTHFAPISPLVRCGP